MKRFNEVLDADLKGVFLAPVEFGEWGELAGHEPIRMVWEPLELELPGITDERTSVNYEGVTIFVRSLDMPEKLEPQRLTSFMHEEWFVLDTTDSEAMRTIRLYRERT